MKPDSKEQRIEVVIHAAAVTGVKIYIGLWTNSKPRREAMVVDGAGVSKRFRLIVKDSIRAAACRCSRCRRRSRRCRRIPLDLAENSLLPRSLDSVGGKPDPHRGQQVIGCATLKMADLAKRRERPDKESSVRNRIRDAYASKRR